MYGFHIVNGSFPAGEVGTPYRVEVTAASGTAPYTWSVTGALPPGLTLDPTTGVIDGTPTMAGTTTFTLVVTDAATPQQTAMAPFQIVIAEATGGGCGCRVGGRGGLGGAMAMMMMLACAWWRRRRRDRTR